MIMHVDKYDGRAAVKTRGPPQTLRYVARVIGDFKETPSNVPFLIIHSVRFVVI